MATEKDIALISVLIEQTRSGKIRWEATAVPGQFVFSFKGRYNASLEEDQGRFVPAGEGDKYLRLLDASDQELVVVSDTVVPDVGQLYELARRQALNVDDAIDNIIGFLS